MTVSIKELVNSPAIKRKRKIRTIKDKFWKYGITAGGFAVIAAISLIFVYLLSVTQIRRRLQD